MAAVIVRLDMVEMYGLGDAGYLIKRAHVVPQLRKIHQAIAIAFEVAVVYGIKAQQRRKQPPVRFGDLLAKQNDCSLRRPSGRSSIANSSCYASS